MNDRKSILITGCSSGIGLYCATYLQEKGYKVYATARRPESVEMLKSLGLDAHLLDVTNAGHVDAVLEYIERDNTTLYALFNNAGYSQVGGAEDLSAEGLRAQFDVNFFAPIELGNRVMKRFMIPQGYGRIIQNSSVFGLVTSPYRAAYCSSKFALEAYSDVLRQENVLLKSQIYTSLIEPGPIVSNIRQNKVRYFEQYISPHMQNSRHHQAYQSLTRGFAVTGKIPMTLGPEAVAEKLLHALQSSKPKARYHVTRLTSILYMIKRVFGQKAFDAVAQKLARKETGLS